MNKIVKIEGLHCPNCAKNLQNEINKIKGIENANIDIVKATLSFDSKNPDEKIKEIISLTKKLEPNVQIIYENSAKKSNKDLILDISTLLIGITLAILCLFIP